MNCKQVRMGMLDENYVKTEIEKMRRKNPNLTVIEVANRFGRSYSWAFNRMNPKYAPMKTKEVKNG